MEECWKKLYLEDFKLPWLLELSRLVTIFQKLMNYGDFLSHPSLWRTENFQKRIYWTDKCEWKCLVEIKDKRRISATCYNKNMSLSAPHVEPLCRWPAKNVEAIFFFFQRWHSNSRDIMWHKTWKHAIY